MGWLGPAEREGRGPPRLGEQQFLALALQAWRATNADGRKALKAQMKQLAQG